MRKNGRIKSWKMKSVELVNKNDLFDRINTDILSKNDWLIVQWWKKIFQMGKNDNYMDQNSFFWLNKNMHAWKKKIKRLKINNEIASLPK